MSELQLPEQLKGAWEHALIVSYGADLPFFERILSRQLPVGCRNRVILADRRQYLEACIRYAEGGGLIRTLNQHYVADGLDTRHAMHAKLILLASPIRGRLLVGSGNLGFQGYASGGELFTQYDYEPDEATDLPAFVAARQFVERLIKIGEAGSVAAARVEYLFEDTPWLFQPVGEEPPTLRHNFDQSFLEQLVADVNGRPVTELTVAAPFYDADADALDSLIRRLEPSRVRILVQPERTSVNPEALDRVKAAHANVEIIPFVKDLDGTYVHAKLILVKLHAAAICLQGSPNISRVALLRHGDEANVELANLSHAKRDGFDDLIAALDLGKPVGSAASLSLRYDPDDSPIPPELAGWHLTRADWSGADLNVHFSGKLPTLDGATLFIGQEPFPLALLGKSDTSFSLRIDEPGQDLLARSLAIAIVWFSDEGQSRSNPVFPFNLPALERVLEASTGSERLAWVGSLDELDDDELEQLLQELSDSVVIDNQSLWRLAGRDLPTTTDEEALRLAYSDIDYEALKQHPKIRQYRLAFGAAGGDQRSRLQMILASIAANFHRPPAATTTHPQVLSAVDESDAETDEELELDLEERERRRSALEGHLRRIFQNFIRRYLKGATTPTFEERVGAEVIAQNYLIFSYILWRLFRKEWMPAAFLVEALLETWQRFWGEEGFVARLDSETRERVVRWLQERHGDSLFLASIYYANQQLRAEQLDSLRLQLRDRWREALEMPPFPVRDTTVAEAIETVGRLLIGRPLSSGQFAAALQGLSDFETRKTFLSTSNELAGGWFEDQMIMRPSLSRQDKVACLMLAASADRAQMIELLSSWMRFERRDYYRIKVEHSGSVCFYDTLVSEGTYWGGPGSDAHTFDRVPPVSRPWDSSLVALVGSPSEDNLGIRAAVSSL